MSFLSNPSRIIVFPGHSPLFILPTHLCFWDLTDVTLAFEDANSKFLKVVSVADLDAEEGVDDSLVEILKLIFGQDFKAGALSRFRGWSLVETLKLNFDVTCFGERTLPLGLLYPWHGNVFSQYLDSYLSLKIQVIQIYAFSKCDVRAVWTSFANFVHTLSLFKGCKSYPCFKRLIQPLFGIWP